MQAWLQLGRSRSEGAGGGPPANLRLDYWPGPQLPPLCPAPWHVFSMERFASVDSRPSHLADCCSFPSAVRCRQSVSHMRMPSQEIMCACKLNREAGSVIAQHTRWLPNYAAAYPRPITLLYHCLFTNATSHGSAGPGHAAPLCTTAACRSCYLHLSAAATAAAVHAALPLASAAVAPVHAALP